jgi:hypothetical protein
MAVTGLLGLARVQLTDLASSISRASVRSIISGNGSSSAQGSQTSLIHSSHCTSDPALTGAVSWPQTLQPNIGHQFCFCDTFTLGLYACAGQNAATVPYYPDISNSHIATNLDLLADPASSTRPCHVAARIWINAWFAARASRMTHLRYGNYHLPRMQEGNCVLRGVRTSRAQQHE